MPLPASVEILLILFSGLVLGSFSSAIAWREPRQIPWGAVRSHCISCKTSLGIPDLFPVFSWLIAKGKCRHCQQRVSFRYPVTEISVALACLGVYAVWGLTPEAIAIMVAIPFLAALFMIDIERMILPDRLTGLCAICAFAFLFFTSEASRFPLTLIFHFLSGLTFAFLIWGGGKLVSLLKKRDALGFGDVKFFALAGFWLGFSYLPAFLVISGALGLVQGAIWKVITKKPVFPFGPALIGALYLCLLLKGSGYSFVTFSG